MRPDRPRVRLASALWAIAAGILGPAMTHADNAFRHLTGPEITARFSGMEFTDEVHWGLIFAPGGRLTSRQTGGRMTAVEGEPSHGRALLRARERDASLSSGLGLWSGRAATA